MKAADKAKVIEAITATVTDQPTCWTVVSAAVKETGVPVKDWREVRNFIHGMMQAGVIEYLPTIFSEAWVTCGAPILTTRTTGQALAEALTKAGYVVAAVVEPTDTTPGRVDVTDGVYIQLATDGHLIFFYKGDSGEFKKHHAGDDMKWSIEITDAMRWLVSRFPQHANVKAVQP